MSQLIVILFLVIAVVRAVTKSKGRGAKPPQTPVSPVSIGQEPETVDEAPESRRAKARKHVRAVQPKPAVETEGEGYSAYSRHEIPPMEPIACGNAQEHSHAHAAETAVTVDDLRRAVITSEILSKPVSLRDE